MLHAAHDHCRARLRDGLMLIFLHPGLPRRKAETLLYGGLAASQRAAADRKFRILRLPFDRAGNLVQLLCVMLRGKVKNGDGTVQAAAHYAD